MSKIETSASRSYDAAYSAYLEQKNKADKEKQLILTKTNIGGWFFDAVLKIDHNITTKITDFPVMSGASLTDHAYVQPAILVLEIGMTDTAKSIISNQFTGGKSRAVTAFSVLQELQTQRIPMQVFTRLKLYQNMLIESIVSPDDYTTQYGLKATITMREVRIANVKTIKLSSRPGSTVKTNKGKAEPVKPNQSVAKQIAELAKGKTKKKK